MGYLSKLGQSMLVKAALVFGVMQTCRPVNGTIQDIARRVVKSRRRNLGSNMMSENDIGQMCQVWPDINRRIYVN